MAVEVRKKVYPVKYRQVSRLLRPKDWFPRGDPKRGAKIMPTPVNRGGRKSAEKEEQIAERWSQISSRDLRDYLTAQVESDPDFATWGATFCTKSYYILRSHQDLGGTEQGYELVHRLYAYALTAPERASCMVAFPKGPQFPQLCCESIGQRPQRGYKWSGPVNDALQRVLPLNTPTPWAMLFRSDCNVPSLHPELQCAESPWALVEHLWLMHGAGDLEIDLSDKQPTVTRVHDLSPGRDVFV